MLHNLLRKMCDEWKKYWNNSCYIIQTKLLTSYVKTYFFFSKFSIYLVSIAFFVSWRNCAIFFVNRHGNWWRSNFTIGKKIRRNIASFLQIGSQSFDVKSSIFVNLSLYFQIVLCKKRVFCIFFRKGGSISFYSLKVNILM